VGIWERQKRSSAIQYMTDRIFKPLGMNASTAFQPPDANASGNLARGYEWTGSRPESDGAIRWQGRRWVEVEPLIR
jgi:CubicO group peptidase (beta-lactamase class C family)